MKAVKFGGTSVSSAKSIYTVKRIIESDPDRRFIVVSAPGKTDSEDKITDILIYAASKSGNERVKAFEKVEKRFRALCDGLSLNGALDGDLAVIETELIGASADYIISRGEYLTAKLLSLLLGFEFVDAAEIIKFDGGAYDDKQTESVCAKRLAGISRAVIPGFYGGDEKGGTVTFPRGGSDISGAIVARAIAASLYENYTDVDGFMTCDPRIVPHAEPIDILTYGELSELLYMGANVLHPEAVFPVRSANIPTRILNTFNRKALGTVIVPTAEFLNGGYERKNKSPVTAIAGKRNLYSLYIRKSAMSKDVGFIRRLLGCFEAFNIPVENISSGIDFASVFFGAQEKKTAEELAEAVKRETVPDSAYLTAGVSLIAIVGHGIKSRPDVAARAVNRLCNANINLKTIVRSDGEINIILAVSDNDFERALIALNGEFEV
ncbi:MAG: aspartate kinase [Clostridiales bacterium]|nr:aspartate kinase [Clostridiales bacterium]